MRYALIKNNVVENVALWDNESKWGSHEGYTVVQSDNAGIGWSYSDGVFSPPAEQAPTYEQLVAQAEQEKQRLRLVADAEIAWRQDAVDAGIATEEEITALTGWKKYRVLLMRMDTSTAPDIDLPEIPA